MSATVRMTLTENGMPNESKTSDWSTTHTTKKRTDAPSILEMKKNHAPVR